MAGSEEGTPTGEPDGRSINGRSAAKKKNGMFLLSAAAQAPSFACMAQGQMIRRSFTGKRFQALFYISLLLLGLYIVIRSLQ